MNKHIKMSDVFVPGTKVNTIAMSGPCENVLDYGMAETAATVAIESYDRLIEENVKNAEIIQELKKSFTALQTEAYRIRAGINENLLGVMIELRDAPSDEERNQFLSSTIDLLLNEQEATKRQLN